jgi:hypothetical protein
MLLVLWLMCAQEVSSTSEGLSTTLNAEELHAVGFACGVVFLGIDRIEDESDRAPGAGLGCIFVGAMDGQGVVGEQVAG